MDKMVEDTLLMKKEVYPKCIMCRKELKNDDYSEEHIYPKWLQKKYNLQNQTIKLPNGMDFAYKKFKVPCCAECNNGKMSKWENIIKNAVEAGYDEFIKVDKKIIAWWLYKLYYSKLVKETQMKFNVRDKTSGKLVREEQLWKYNHLYGYMNALLNDYTFTSDVPYELYIYRTNNNHNFDYLDIIETNTLLIMMNDILIICALDTCGKYKKHYKRELDILDGMDKVHHIQGVELFVRMSYYRDHYEVEVMPENLPIGPIPKNHVVLQKTNFVEKRKFLEIELHLLLMQYLSMRAPDMYFPEYIPGTMLTTIK